MIRFLKPLSFIPALLLMYMIYSFSAQDGVSSAQLSYTVSYKTIEVAGELLGADFQDWEIDQLASRFQIPVRKLAHMTEYFALAIAVAFPLYVYGLRGILLLILAGMICVGFACGDEYHQSMVAGRGPSKRDVLIDSIGVFCGIILVRIIGWTGRRTIFRPFSRDSRRDDEAYAEASENAGHFRQPEPDPRDRQDPGYARQPAHGYYRQSGAQYQQQTARSYSSRQDSGYSRQSGQEYYGQPEQRVPRRAAQDYYRQTDQGVPRQAAQDYYRQTDQEYPRQTAQDYCRQTDQGYPRQTAQDYCRQTDQGYMRQTAQEYYRQTDQRVPQQPAQEYCRQPDQRVPRQAMHGYAAQEDYEPEDYEEEYSTSDRLSEDMSLRKLVNDLKEQKHARHDARKTGSVQSKI